ncbi:MAG: ribonuclease HII [bacterium]|nr:ribonuclease HII [bacterium]MCP4798795.1 ribonuclease HII [bacterium]
MQSKLAAFDQIKSDSGRLLIAGVDEAGRGCLAGPVVAAAVILDSSSISAMINDSKQLTANRRDLAYDEVIKSALSWSAFAVSPAEIDSINILQATMRAMSDSIRRLPMVPDLVLIDGNKAPETDVDCETVIKGDAKSACIAAASIIAKVTRDRIMLEMHERYDEYGFDENKGYGSQPHMDALKMHGATPIHRKTYRPVADLLQGSLF